MTLAADLISKPPREKSATGGRYEYQTMWGLALLFEQHGTQDDYAIVFEFRDDVVLLNSATEPTTARFYQVKSKATNGGWTLTKLLQREKAKTETGTKEKPSHIDKMFDNVAKFPDAVLSADFVSNQLCGFNTNATFRLKECETADFEKVIKSLREVYPSATNAQIGLLGFQHTNLSLGDVVSHTLPLSSSTGSVSFKPRSWACAKARRRGVPAAISLRKKLTVPLRSGRGAALSLGASALSETKVGLLLAHPLAQHIRMHVQILDTGTSASAPA